MMGQMGQAKRRVAGVCHVIDMKDSKTKRVSGHPIFCKSRRPSATNDKVIHTTMHVAGNHKFARGGNAYLVHVS